MEDGWACIFASPVVFPEPTKELGHRHCIRDEGLVDRAEHMLVQPDCQVFCQLPTREPILGSVMRIADRQNVFVERNH